MMVFGVKLSTEMVAGVTVVLISTVILFVQLPFVSASCTNWALLPDNDCDGLADDWELSGYDINGDRIPDLTFLQANPNYADIYVELDYMQNHKPRTGVVEAVVAAFKAAPISNPNGTSGINLHVFVNEQIPHTSSITMWSGLDSLKDAWFGSDNSERSNILRMQAKDNTYHYVLFIHQYNGGSSSGLAELPGDDLVVSLGATGFGKDPVTGHTVGSVDQQQGTLMHELGHNLGLRHGGNVDENCKPNYLSVMSYSLQFSNYNSQRDLDYSRSQLNTLDENSLVEQNGISPASEAPGKKAVWGFNSLPRLTQPLSLSLNPIDWNNNGITTGTSSVNINNLGPNSGCTSTMKTPLAGFDDWMNMIYWGTTGGWGNGTTASASSGAGSSATENSTNDVSSIDAMANGSLIDAISVGNSINVASVGNRTVHINTLLPINVTNQDGGLMTTVPTEERPGLDEVDVENIKSSRLLLLESVIDQIKSLPDDNLKNKTSKAAIIDSLTGVENNFNSNSTDLVQAITDLKGVRNQIELLVVNPNSQGELTLQLDNIILALDKQR